MNKIMTQKESTSDKAYVMTNNTVDFFMKLWSLLYLYSE